MNNRFKFRVWMKTGEIFMDAFESVLLEICDVDEIDFDGGRVHATPPSNMSGYAASDINDCVLMQCTGLVDKNGKLIYEGDIVEVPPGFSGDGYHDRCIAIVKWDGQHSCPGYYLYNPHDKYGVVGQDEFRWGVLSIIGNAYENKELLDK